MDLGGHPRTASAGATAPQRPLQSPQVTPKDRPTPGYATVKPQRLPRRRARRSCCLEKCVCPRQTVAGHCFSMTQTSGNAPVPSCLLSGGFPLPSGCASRLQDISYLLFSHSSVSRKRLCPALLGAPVQQPEQSQSVPGKCSLQLDSQRAAGGNSTALPENGVSPTKHTGLQPFTSSDGPKR